MSRRPANHTQADIARATRAAKQAGALKVEVRRDAIIIHLTPETNTSFDEPKDIVVL